MAPPIERRIVRPSDWHSFISSLVTQWSQQIYCVRVRVYPRYLRTVQKLGPWKCGAVVAGICEIDFRDTTGSVNSGEEGDLVYLVVLLVKL